MNENSSDNTSKQPMRVVFTGGSVGGEYDFNDGVGMPANIGQFERWFRLAVTAPFDIQFVDLCQKHSSDINDEDRYQMGQRCQHFKGNLVMIPHGTKTLRETALYLAVNVDRPDMTIVLYGARGPAWGYSDSDGALETGCALIALQKAGPGVFISTQQGWEKVEAPTPVGTSRDGFRMGTED